MSIGGGGGYINVDSAGSVPLANPVVGGASGIVTGTERERNQNLGAQVRTVAAANTALTAAAWVTVASIVVPANTKHWVAAKVCVPVPANTGVTLMARLFDGTTEYDRAVQAASTVVGETHTLELVLPGVMVTGAQTVSLQVQPNSTGFAIDAGGGDGRTSITGHRVN